MLSYDGEFVFAFFDEAGVVQSNSFVGNFGAVYRDGIAGEGLFSVGFGRAEAGFNQNIYDIAALFRGWEKFGKRVKIFGSEGGEIGVFVK